MARDPLICLFLLAMPYLAGGQKMTTPRPSVKGTTDTGYLMYEGKIPLVPWLEAYHDPSKVAPPHDVTIKGFPEQVPHKTEISPDFRLPEPPWRAHRQYFYQEWNRPYRISPHKKMTSMWHYERGRDNPKRFGCYCSTVFKRLVPLATCAVLTSRHIITTATSTEVVLKKYDKKRTLENILGFWYDHDANIVNSSMYASVARIHLHPNYMKPDKVNRSHPLPCVFDIALYASTFRFQKSFLGLGTDAVLCQRGGSHFWHHTSTTPKPWELLVVIGFQFVWDINLIPTPFHKYAVKVRVHEWNFLEPCPKVEWGWFHCIYSISWARYGLDSGAMLHACHEDKGWRYDGLIGMNTISMRLRSQHITHYFMVLDTHRILDFLYSGYTGRIPYRYLDSRFDDTQWAAPVKKDEFMIKFHHDFTHVPDWKYWEAWN